MQLIDRFSSHLRDVLARSIQLAAELKNIQVDPIHLWFAISNEKGSVGSELINRFRISPKVVEQALLALPVQKSPPASPTTAARTEQLLPLSTTTKIILEKALTVAERRSHSYIGTEHLLLALVESDDPALTDIFTVSAINIADLKKQLELVLSNATHFPHLGDVAETVEHMEDALDTHFGEETPPLAEPMPTRPNGKKKESALEFFATNLTSAAVQKNIDPVVGRDAEIERVIHILCRRTKNNPLLLGEPGVGKTAIVEGLAKKILEGAVPDILLNKKIYALDMSMLIAGTMYRGEFEARLRQVIDEATHNPNIILFIDELHNIVGTGSNQGTMDAANILKPPLSRGALRCIGATTPTEHKKYIENDAALERRFQTVYAKEPSVDDTVRILSGIRPNYELYHRVHISDEAIRAAVRLSSRYITNKFLPDKAIDLLDETAAAKRLAHRGEPGLSKLAKLEQKLEKVILAKESAAQNDRFDDAVRHKREEANLREDIKKVTSENANKKITYVGTLSEDDVLHQVAKIIGTPPSELLLDDVDSLNDIEKRLRQHIVGQDSVIKTVSQLIRQAKLGLSNPDRPLASFLFVGESGVGKTELAKTVARVLYTNPEAFIKLDMSEFNESFGVSKLLGSPAGYIGYKEGNHFTDKIKMNPHCVILFDEIDKAHRDIVKLLLQMLENGEITDSTGKKISLRHAIVILTTSYGAREGQKGAIGFGNGATATAEAETHVADKLKEFFSPEVINRLDSICHFAPLSTKTLTEIAALELNKFNEQLNQYHTTISTDAAVLNWAVHQLPQHEHGARGVRRFVRKEVESLMSAIILRRKIKKQYSLQVSNNALTIH